MENTTQTSHGPSKEELRQRLQVKLNGARLQRMNRTYREGHYNRMKEDLYQNLNISPDKLDLDKIAQNMGMGSVVTKDQKLQKKRERKKLKELEKKVGQVSEADYHDALDRIKRNTYKGNDSMFRDHNIIKLYRKQQQPQQSQQSQQQAQQKPKIREISEHDADKLLLENDGGGDAGDAGDDDSVSSDLSE